jgi:hypothetical protein
MRKNLAFISAFPRIEILDKHANFFRRLNKRCLHVIRKQLAAGLHVPELEFAVVRAESARVPLANRQRLQNTIVAEEGKQLGSW